MRLLRILLQLLILALFLPILLLVAVQRPLELGVLVAVAGLFVFLLLLTLLLREYTAHRRNPFHEISNKVLGAFLGFIGCVLLLFAWQIASGQYHPSGRRGQLLAALIELIGPWLPAAAFLAAGLQAIRFGYRAWRDR